MQMQQTNIMKGQINPSAAVNFFVYIYQSTATERVHIMSPVTQTTYFHGTLLRRD